MRPELTGNEPTIARGRYVLLGRLGRGGMAQVFRAWDAARETHCAVKIMASKLSAKTAIRQRFAREANAMRRMDHPNVVKIIDVDLEAKLPFLVMEIAEGGTLEGWIEAHGEMPPQMVLDVMLQVCAGVMAAHDNGIVHRDLKPPNVLIDHNGVCRVSDFGIAQVKDTTNLTGTGHAMGTWLYMPPEQRLNAKEVDERGDIYNVGVMMFALLTGDAPPDLCLAENDPRVLQVIEQPFRDIIEICVKFLPEDRFQTMYELIIALKALQGSLPTTEGPGLVMEHQTDELDRNILLDLNTLLDRPVASETLVVADRTTDTFTLDSSQPNHPGTVPRFLDASELSEDQLLHQSGLTRAEEPEPVFAVPKTSLLRRIASFIVVLGTLIAIPIGLGVAGIALGTQSVNGAAATAHATERGLVEAIDGGIVADLVELGADPAFLETARQEFQSSVSADRYTRLIGILDATADEVLGDMKKNDPVRMRARTRLRDIHDRTDDLVTAQENWHTAAAGTTGRLAVSIALAEAPPQLEAP